MQPVKIVIVVMLLLIIASLGKALFHMIRGDRDKDSMVRALSWRVGLSVSLVLFIVLASALGIIEPHDVYRR